MKQSYRCWAEVDLEALRENLAWLRHRVGPSVKIMTVVKSHCASPMPHLRLT